ncbi:MAG TPA: fibronectin type III domain-containing protein, partial [Candidatus Limnocylindrales bacterium]|nr:fibronectin type III domain-containing protein [Candidatus Limnocylindrales bacterium]
YDRSLRLTATGTDGSAAALVDTQAGLTEVGCATETADTTFAALAGETYYLQLGGPATSDSGTLALAAAADAANDDFANALAIDALPYADTRDTTTSHLEPEEPLPSCAPGTPPYNSTWYRFEAAADTGVQIQATGHPTRIGIYTGATLGNLDEVACLGGMTEDSRVTFSEGTTYFVQVVGVGGSGHLSLTVEEAPPLDEASPIIDTPPVPAPGSGTTLQTSMTTISWTAHDDGSGLAGFELQRKNNTGAWKTVATPADPTATVLEKLNTTHAFRVRAFDNEGNVSDWTTGPSYLPQLKQESWAKLLYRGGWSREVRSEASGGSLRSTSNLNAYVSFGFTGRGLQWVTTHGPGLGTAQITIDGVPTLVDLSSASSMSKWVAFAASWPEAAVHTVEIRNTNGLRIDLDALIVFK